jgi:hypothetical protein
MPVPLPYLERAGQRVDISGDGDHTDIPGLRLFPSADVDLKNLAIGFNKIPRRAQFLPRRHHVW